MRFTLALVSALLALPSLFAQSAPKLDSSSVTGIQRGSTQQITLKGDALSGISKVLVTGSGMSATPVAPTAPAVSLEGGAGGLTSAPINSAQSITLQCVVSSEAALGSRELRVASPNGVSNPLIFQLSDLVELADPKTNTNRSNALIIPLPAAVSGVISANTESDFFRFKAPAGKTLIFDLQANRSGSPLDANLILHSADGKELQRSEDAHGLDPFLEFTPAADGEFLLELHDLRFQGGGDYRYRLVAGNVPYLESLFPFGGKRGGSVAL
jgi:hypothetical protein